jgi:4-hydroxy-tetrahydrodipicolinate synthase
VKRFAGLFTAIVTPFREGQVDLTSFRKLVQHQWAAGVDGLVVNGTTGESPNLSVPEIKGLIDIARNENKSGKPIVIGTGSNSTSKTVDLTLEMAEYGCDAVLVVVPYYNKPTQEGLRRHFVKVADSSPVPVILYNVPGRTITELKEDTIVELSQHDNIVGIKEASGDLELVRRLRERVSKDFVLTSGDDGSCIDFILRGGDGVISVVSHLIASPMQELCRRARSGDASAAEDFKKYVNLLESLYIEPNPVPVKNACEKMGLIESSEVRLPLVAMTEKNASELHKRMSELKLC